ncbi:2-dehydropantoate 2-reductase [Candidatus Borrarchaeum sp.]|uniref:ketopantoate reductase family protein n=1 Tax=Candidatus Borrarchaeum sp. TaxID=2846742 RepID=UPI00257BD265|nr:2-dehydropantoate 2-reductase [Candidatus Borrarchaeum sp.]
MKIAIIGIGGVGGYYGGKLAQKYGSTGEHDIFFVARGEHLAEIRKNGLKVITQEEGEFTAIPTTATDDPKDLGLVDLVLFCVKTYDLESAAQQLIDNIHEKTVAITILNGVDNTDRLRTILTRSTVLNGCVYISSTIQAPGVIRQIGGPRKLIFGPENNDPEKYRYIEEILRNADIRAELTADISVQVWTKYIFIGPLATIDSLLRKPLGAIIENENNKQMLKGLMEEVNLIAKKRGIFLPEDIIPLSLEKASGFPYETKTSMQRDFESGRKTTEIETFAGYIVKTGKELGVETPLYQEAYNELLKKLI